ncbi:MAG: M23 family metallopeptidase, partial [Deltaproteobacteria bacterium]
EYFVWILSIVSVFALAYDNIRLHLELLEFKESHRGSIQMASEIRELKSSVAEIDSVLNRLNKFSSKLKVLSHIKDQFEEREAIRQAAKSTRRSTREADLDREEERDLQKIRLRLPDLRSESDFHDRVLLELVDFYSQRPNLVAAIPALLPAPGRITSPFGFRKLPAGGWQIHEGIDIAANFGTEVVAPADGIVEESHYSPGYGRYVILNHGYGLKTRFAHASKVLVKAGEWIKRGTQIALVGGSGRTRGVHLHYEISLNGVPVDPRDYM